MVWVGLCAVILLVGLVYLFLTGREVWRKGVRLAEEVETATARAGAASQPTP